MKKFKKRLGYKPNGGSSNKINSSLKFEIMAKQLYVASQRVL